MAEVRELDASASAELRRLWATATAARRAGLGLEPHRDGEAVASALERAGAFGVGVVDGDRLLAAAVAMPARQDEGRSERRVPGLAHVSQVATSPSEWRSGFGRRVVQGILAAAARRGYARLQLWTETSNAPARALYDGLGFVRTHRELTNAHGEAMVHYVRELTVEPQRPRAAVRIIGITGDGAVLLLRFRDPVDGHEVWEPPGGGIELGETPRQAAEREWVEETGLAVPDVVGEGVLVGRDNFWAGQRYVVSDRVFLARVARPAPPVTDAQTDDERSAYLGHAWVPWHELSGLGGADDPDVAAALRRLDPAGPWSAAEG